MANPKLNFDWERAVILELNREHEYTCRVRRTNLRPIAIVLYDSDTRWGQFDSRTRTISISRRLVNEHPWDHVLGVLLHEMAHQYVAEQFPDTLADTTPHGELFKDACRRLGIPEQYSRASLDLQTCAIDWRSETQDEESEKILDKVKKLLALANSTNEHEALLAMERVREIYAKYNLETSQTSKRKDYVHLVITTGKKRVESWEQRTMSLLTEHFFVEVVGHRQFDPRTGERVHAIELIGRRQNVAMAEYVYHFLLQQVVHLTAQATHAGRKLARSERTSFKLGILHGFAQKLKTSEQQSQRDEKKAEAPSSGIKTSTSLSVIGQALTLFRKNSDLRDYLSQIYPRLAKYSSSSIRVDGAAFAAGNVAGRSITLNKPISSHGGNSRRQISGRPG